MYFILNKCALQLSSKKNFTWTFCIEAFHLRKHHNKPIEFVPGAS